MAKLSRFEQLDQAVEAALARREPAPVTELEPVVQVAVTLCDLPRAEFKARLKSELERKAAMGKKTSPDMRAGLHTVVPYVAVREALELIDFVKQAFGAEGSVLGTGSQGGLHAEYRIGDSTIMIGGGAKWSGPSRPVALHLYVGDADAVYQRALEAGATSLYAAMDQDYGDREAGVRDVAGNVWFIATRKGPSYIPEGLRSVTPYLFVPGAAKMMEFLKQAFGAEEHSCDKKPDGTILHASMRIGDSVVEMGEARPEWPPMPTTFSLYVDDVEAWYRRALAAGAASLAEPADQPYGDRVAAVTDPFGNQWYMSKHIGKQ